MEKLIWNKEDFKKELETEKEYNENHSLCCDAEIVNGRCFDCKEGV